MEAVEILGGKEALEATLREKLGMPDLVLSEVRRQEVLNLLAGAMLSIEDVFRVCKDDLERWKKELNIRPETGGDDNIALLSIVLDALSELCKPRDPLTPEQAEKIRELRKKYGIHVQVVGLSDSGS